MFCLFLFCHIMKNIYQDDFDDKEVIEKMPSGVSFCRVEHVVTEYGRTLTLTDYNDQNINYIRWSKMWHNF